MSNTKTCLKEQHLWLTTEEEEMIRAKVSCSCERKIQMVNSNPSWLGVTQLNDLTMIYWRNISLHHQLWERRCFRPLTSSIRILRPHRRMGGQKMPNFQQINSVGFADKQFRVSGQKIPKLCVRHTYMDAPYPILRNVMSHSVMAEPSSVDGSNNGTFLLILLRSLH